MAVDILRSKDSCPNSSSSTQNNEKNNIEIVDRVTDSSVKVHKLSEPSGQKRLALSPPSSSTLVSPSRPEKYNDIKRITDKFHSPSERSFIYSRRDHPERSFQSTDDEREEGEIVDSDEEKEDGEVSNILRTSF